MKNIKEMLNRFGILVIRAICPEKGNRGAQKLGLTIVALSALLGVTQASNLKEMFLGSAKSAAEIHQPKAAQTTVPKLAAKNQVLTVDTAQASTEEISSNAPNIVDLIADSETIFRGMVKEVTDGFENGIPYTEVTVQVNEALRGQLGEEYKFRQFGLTQPRKMENGKVYLGVTPEGWSKYAVGDDAMFFLYKPASMTGLQTTVGLGQGKVIFKGGNAESQMGNDGLFANVELDTKLQNDKDKRLLSTKKGAVNAEGFQSFVRRAVNNKWVEGGKLRHVKK